MPFDEEKCWVCGCTDNHACPGGCYWALPGLCSRCADIMGNQKETLISFLQRKAERAYLTYANYCYRDENRGEEFKLANGQFTKENLKAHCEAAELLGKHKAFHEVIKFIREAGK